MFSANNQFIVFTINFISVPSGRLNIVFSSVITIIPFILMVVTSLIVVLIAATLMSILKLTSSGTYYHPSHISAHAVRIRAMTTSTTRMATVIMTIVMRSLWDTIVRSVEIAT